MTTTAAQLAPAQRDGTITGLALMALGQHMVDHHLPLPIGIDAVRSDTPHLTVLLGPDAVDPWAESLTVTHQRVVPADARGSDLYDAWHADCTLPDGHRVELVHLIPALLHVGLKAVQS